MTPARHETRIITIPTCPRAQSRIHAWDTRKQDTTRHPYPVKRRRTQRARTPRRQAGTSATTQPVTHRPQRLADETPCISAPQRTTRQRRRPDEIVPCSMSRRWHEELHARPPRHPLGALPGTQGTEWSATRRASTRKPMGRGRGERRGTSRGAGRAGVGPRSAVILGRIVTTLPGRGHGRQGAHGDKTTGESMHGEEVRHSGGCRGRGSSRRLAGA